MKPKVYKSLLLREINSLNQSSYAKSPTADFTRCRKLPFNTLITTMLRMEGQSMGNELISIFPRASETPSVSAFIQQRNKLKPGVFDDLFHALVLSTESVQLPKTINGLRLLAIDGSDIHIPTDPTHVESLISLKQGRETYNMLHMNALYDLLQKTYVDEIIQDYNRMNEHKAFDAYPPSEIKRLYSMRWGIETSFRSLKYTVGLLYFHSKKAEYIRHEIVARLIMYNFSEMITTHVIIHRKDRKYDYKINFAVAVHVCRLFFRGDIAPPDLEAQLSRNIVPIRPDRRRKREKHSSSVISFTYRLA